MLRTLFALAVAGFMCAAVSGTTQAAPIAPLASGVATQDSGVTQVWWRHGWHRHCWRGPYGHLHCN
jgi:hypothetical protein